MTNIEETSNPYFRLLSESDDQAEDISLQVALFLRFLNGAYPDPVVDPIKALSALENRLAQQIVNWLKSEHLIKVEGDQAWLTLSGNETVRAVCRTDPLFRGFFDEAGEILPSHGTELVLTLLKTHFAGGRSSGR